jgi:acyl-coenzyme A synthetase/AMP-(fatty) acid ligase
VLQKTPLSFDASVWEVFAPLLSGGRLVLARPAGQQDPAYLWQVMAEQQVTTVQLVPSMLKAWLQEALASAAEQQQWSRIAGQRQVFSGGEPLTPELRTNVFQTLGRVELHNLYGPTETCIQTVVHSCGEGEGGPVPIGRPIANVRLFILDTDLEPVPVGVTGELYIGGVAVARGYLNRPGLTAARFIANPFGSAERLYRTGDLARYKADGCVEYVGRSDNQVKVNGYRIEPTEVELALLRHGLVKAAVVSSWRDSEGVARLIAHVVPLDGQIPSADSLREAAWTTLPYYMVPSAFVVLNEFPRTASGKVDKTHLPAPGAAETAKVYVPPRTQLERELCGFWADILGRERVGIDDNFFDLGGHSLLATRVLSHIRQTADLELSLRVLFEEQTVRRLAARMETELEKRTRERARWRKSLTEELTSKIAAITDEEVAARLQELRRIQP